MSNNYKVAIEGAYGEDNFGDDALLKVVYNSISKKYAAQDIIVVGKLPSNSKGLRNFIGNSDYTYVGSNVTYEAENRVYGGGTQFFSFKKSSSLFFKIKVLLKKPSYLLWFLKRKLHSEVIKEKKHFVGVGLGPFEEPEKLQGIKNSFENAKSIFVRDTVSLNYADSVGIKPINLYTDLCFSENYDSYITEKKEIKKVSIILRDWIHSDSNFVPSDFDQFEKSGNYDVEYIVFGDDAFLIKALKEGNKRFYKYESGEQGFENMLNRIASTDLVITSRFHGLVYSMLLRVPAIALNIEPKLKIASKELHSIACLEHSEISSLDSIISKLDISKELDEIAKVTEEKREVASNMIAHLLENMQES